MRLSGHACPTMSNHDLPTDPRPSPLPPPSADRLASSYGNECDQGAAASSSRPTVRMVSVWTSRGAATRMR